MEHISELRGRLFWVAVWFIVVSGAIFPFFNDVIKLLMRPLGNEKLYYLTPIGGLSFMFKVCMYLGLIATLPVLIYHLYRFIAPVVRKHSLSRGVFYVILSSILALIGIAFAYFVSLPSAMHFLTHVHIAGVSPMLTVDSYLSFIIAYLLAGALLFQLPLIMIIIDTIKPTPPSQWLKYERHMIVAAFIIAMLITPTPNIIDQVILAIPIIIIYQMGIVLIAWRHHRKGGVVAPSHTQPAQEPIPKDALVRNVQDGNTHTPRVPSRPTIPDRPQSMRVPSRGMPTSSVRRSIDGISSI